MGLRNKSGWSPDESSSKVKKYFQLMDCFISFLGLDDGDLLMHVLMEVCEADFCPDGLGAAAITSSQVHTMKALLIGTLEEILKGRPTHLTEHRKQSWIELIDSLSYHVLASQMKLECYKETEVLMQPFEHEVSR